MALDTAKATATIRSLTHKFDVAVQSATPFYPKVCTPIQSDGADEAYGILGSMPGVRKWIDDRKFKSLRAGNYVLKNDPWEISLSIEHDDLSDDRMAMYSPVMTNLGIRAAKHPDKLLFEQMVAGKSQVCWDGQNFYDTDHSWGDSGSQDNDLTFAAATDAVPTAAEFRDAYHAARAKMLLYKDDQGELLNQPIVQGNSNLVICVHPNLEVIAKTALFASLNSGGGTNIVIDAPQVVATGFITDPAEMYLHDTSDGLMPFVFQMREALRRDMKGTDDIEFKDVKFMTKARYAVGYLAWWKSVLTTFT